MNEKLLLEMEKVENKESRDIENKHSEAFDFVRENKDFFEHYAQGRIKIDPAPEGLDTFAFNLENNTIYVNSIFYKKLGFSKEKTIFATCHEIEHFLEKIQMLGEDKGEEKFSGYLKKIEKSKAYSIMDNCIADIHENKSVVSKTNKGMEELEQAIYKEDLFKEKDFTKHPRHLQLPQTILREARVPGEKCEVSPEVRKILDEIYNKKGLLEAMTDRNTPMSLRLKLQDKYIWPKVEELLERDREDRKKEEQGEEGDSSKQDNSQSQEQENKEEKDKKEREGKKTKEGSKKGEKVGSKGKKEEKGRNEGEESNDPNEIFADDYEKVSKKTPNAVSIDEIKKAFEEWKKMQNENSPDKMDEEYAKKIGVEKKDLQEYRKIVETINKIINPETSVSVIEELKDIFNRIIAKRLKPQLFPKYPVEEGDEIADPAQLVSDVRSGNLNPKVWEDTEIKERRGDKFGEVEITLVCDRSSSMTDGDGQKAIEQRKSAVMMMEVLKAFAEMCEEEKTKLEKPLEIKSEIYSFSSNQDGDDKIPLKKMSSELGEAERISVLKKLHNLPGSTTDFNCLEVISANLDDTTKQKLKIGELKKIVFVFTDGGSNDASRVQGILKVLRDHSIVICGIGLTSAGKPVETTYAPKAEVVENIEKLPVVLGSLLKEHLKDI